MTIRAEPSKSLADLWRDSPIRVALPQPDVRVSGLASDSRSVAPGNVFVAVTGHSLDGHAFIHQAIEKGAAVVVGEKEILGLPVPYLPVSDARRALAHLAAAWHGRPARRLTVIGVTGTDGKTTTINLIFEILHRAGRQAGMVSTVNARIGDQVVDTGFHVTTPDALQTQGLLAEMVQAGLTHAILEATSHGLAQRRLDACDFDIGVATNVTHEHLDYHGDYESYRAAKGQLFRLIGEGGPKGGPKGGTQGPSKLDSLSGTVSPFAVLNRDDRAYSYLSTLTDVRQITYGLGKEAQVRAEKVMANTSGLAFTAVGTGFEIPIQSDLLGAYNVSNCLAAIAVAIEGLGLDPEAARQGIAAVQSLPGRMERIDLGQAFTAIVDFAHTPYALQNALDAARAMTESRVIAVFGSAGLRDREKRRMMAEISAELADLTVLTAEDPRTESLEVILEEMAAGARSAGGREGKSFWRVPDRGEALRFAVALAEPGDLVIACGKGHEQSMCFGEIEYPWDDRQALRSALGEFLALEGAPPMPYLPTQDLPPDRGD